MNQEQEHIQEQNNFMKKEKFLNLSPYKNFINYFKNRTEKKFLTESVNQFIESQAWDKLATLFCNGLRLNKSQEKRMVQIMDKEFFPILGEYAEPEVLKKGLDFFNDIPQKGFIIPEEIIHKFLCFSNSKNRRFFNSQISYDILTKYDPLKSLNLKDFIKKYRAQLPTAYEYMNLRDNINILAYVYDFTTQNPQKTLDIWIDFIKGTHIYHSVSYEGENLKDKRINLCYSELIKNYYNNFIKNMLPTLEKSELYKIELQIKKADKKYGHKSEVYNNILEDIHQIKNSDIEIHRLSKISQNIFPEKAQKFMKQTNIEREKINKENLPSNIKEKYNFIHKKFDFIINNKAVVDPKDYFMAEKIISSRIPEILKEFLKFDMEDRNTLKNYDNKTPTDLCIESLDNLTELFTKIVDTIKNEQLNKLSVLSRYSREFKK